MKQKTFELSGKFVEFSFIRELNKVTNKYFYYIEVHIWCWEYPPNNHRMKHYIMGGVYAHKGSYKDTMSVFTDIVSAEPQALPRYSGLEYLNMKYYQRALAF